MAKCCVLCKSSDHVELEEVSFQIAAFHGKVLNCLKQTLLELLD